MTKRLLFSLLLLLAPLTAFADSDAERLGYKMGQIAGLLCPFVCIGMVVVLIVSYVVKPKRPRK